MSAYQRNQLWRDIERVDEHSFDELALRVFRYQAETNILYARFLELLRISATKIDDPDSIPHLPIGFFKTHRIQSGQWEPVAQFCSSGTTGQAPSNHWVCDIEKYKALCVKGFSQFYGHPSEWLVLALLPSYMERSGSSLVVMAEYFAHLSKHAQSGFFLHDLDRLTEVLQNRRPGAPTLLLGVSFALLDLAEQYPQNLNGVTVMETGGMKGRRREITRQALHQTLKSAFQVDHIHSEYGMTELFSQAYAPKGGRFYPAPTLRVSACEVNDPLTRAGSGKTGVLQMTDLGNLDTCSFIATEDIGKVYADGGFEVLGRLDTAEMRGCNLMVE